MFRILHAGMVLTALMALSGCGEPESHASDRDLPGLLLEPDPAPDPAVVAWAGCLDAVTGCIEAGGNVRTCTTTEACGAACVTALDRALVGADGVEAELDAFESVFVTPGAVCRPAESDRP